MVNPVWVSVSRLRILGGVVDRSDPTYHRFLDRLVRARRDSGLTQAEVAGRLRKPQSFVSKCETGERRVDVVELSAFADIYNRPLDWFAGRASR